MKILESMTGRLTELGKVRIGGHGEERKMADGRAWRLPVKHSYFTITGCERDSAGDLKVDTTMSVTPEDRGMIRLAKGQMRPAPSRWSYLVYAIAPLLVIGAWLFLRRR